MKKSFVAGLAWQLLAALLIFWGAAAATTAVADPQPNSDASQGSKSDDLAEILVTAKRHEETATKFDMPIIDVPQSIKVVTSDVLDFASVRDFNDLTKVDAATASQGVYGGVPQITIRGFTNSSNNGIKVDGIPELNAVPIDLGVFDRIEILKGPTSTLYGQNAVAGLINAVSKQPLSTFSGSIQAQVGSFSYSRFQADVGGPITDDGKLSYRFYGALENGGTFVDYEKNKSAVAFAALKYNFDDATSVTETVDYQKRRYTPEYGIAVQEGSLTVPDVPVSRLYDVPWTYRDTTYLLERTVLTHNFSSNWKLRALAEYDDASDVGTDGYSFGLINASGVSDFGGPAQLNGDWLDEQQRQWSFEADLTGTFDLFGHSQMVFIGGDHHFTEDDWNDACSSTLGFLNIYAPNYAALSAPRPNLSDWAQDYQQCQANNYPASSVDTLTTESGVTTQLLLHPVDRLSLMLGTRWDRTTVLSNTWVDVIAGDAFQKTGAAMPTLIDSEKWVSQAGLTYEVHPNIAVYATWGQAFTPQIGTIYPDTPIPPEQGFQYEAGVKGNFGDLTATVDVYDMQRTHIEGVNFTYSNYVVDSGTEESKGVEADIFGIILPGWSIYGSFASVDGKITETDQAHLVNIGARMQGVPKYGESLYSFYELQAGPLKGLSFGGGVVSKQDIVWGLPSVPILGRQVDAGGYTTFDARVSYSYQRLMFDLKANNVFDEKYYTSFAPALRTSILPGRPREFIFSVKYKL